MTGADQYGQCVRTYGTEEHDEFRMLSQEFFSELYKEIQPARGFQRRRSNDHCENDKHDADGWCAGGNAEHERQNSDAKPSEQTKGDAAKADTDEDNGQKQQQMNPEHSNLLVRCRVASEYFPSKKISRPSLRFGRLIYQFFFIL